jgi:hypothetical protein
MKSTWSNELEKGEIVVILQETVRPHPDLPNVPVAYEMANTEEGKKLIRAQAVICGVTNRIYALPPGTPKLLVQTLRKGFIDTFRDPEFVAHAEKSKLEIDPIGGEDVERNQRPIQYGASVDRETERYSTVVDRGAKKPRKKEICAPPGTKLL